MFKFSGVCEELNICQSISIDIAVLRHQHENLNVACFLSGLLQSFDPDCHQQLVAEVGSSD